MPAPGATATNIGAGKLAIVRRALEELTNALSLPAQPNTTQRTNDGRQTSAQLACCVTLTQGAAPGIMVPLVPFFSFADPARARRSMAAALS